MKTLEFTRDSIPEFPECGYGDTVKLYNGTTALIVFRCSTCPNPFHPGDHGKWEDYYAMVDFGEMKGKCIQHEKYGKCILINDGGKVPTLNADQNHSGEKFATQIFVHAGGGLQEGFWRGSAGCFTLSPHDFGNLMDNFDIDEEIIIELVHPDSQRRREYEKIY